MHIKWNFQSHNKLKKKIEKNVLKPIFFCESDLKRECRWQIRFQMIKLVIESLLDLLESFYVASLFNLQSRRNWLFHSYQFFYKIASPQSQQFSFPVYCFCEVIIHIVSRANHKSHISSVWPYHQLLTTKVGWNVFIIRKRPNCI